jgi:ABC-type nickel/cobalt efflux system permease component RcnA
MFFGAFLAGSLTCYKFNRKQLAWLNCFASGLLLGTALGVIIPEGVRSIYSVNQQQPRSQTFTNEPNSKFIEMETHHEEHDGQHGEDHHEDEHDGHGHTEERLLGKLTLY